MNNYHCRNWFIKSFIEEEITSFICHRNHMFLMWSIRFIVHCILKSFLLPPSLHASFASFLSLSEIHQISRFLQFYLHFVCICIFCNFITWSLMYKPLYSRYNSLFTIKIPCLCTKSLQSCLFATPWTVAHQALLSMGFSRQEHWSGLPCLPLIPYVSLLKSHLPPHTFHQTLATTNLFSISIIFSLQECYINEIILYNL